MYIRPKVVDGQTYYQVVESRREDGKVRQRVVVSLSGAASVVGARSMLRRSITRWRRERKKVDVPNPPPAYRRRLESLDRFIAKAEARLAILDGLPDLEFAERGESNQAGTTGGVVPVRPETVQAIQSMFGVLSVMADLVLGRRLTDVEYARLVELADSGELTRWMLSRIVTTPDTSGTTTDDAPVVPGDQPPDERFTLG